MTREEVLSLLGGSEFAGNLICLDSVDSTNNYAKALAGRGAPHGTVVLTREQTAGRGRRGNRFFSPAGKGLYLSVLLRPDLPPHEVVSLTAWIAVAVCGAVEEVTGERPGIKWTNDLILREKKLGGILTELELDGETGRLRYIVAGVGINVSQRAEDFGEELSPMATSLEMALGREVCPARLAAAAIRALEAMAADFPEKKDAYLARYRAGCLTAGRQVRLIRKGESRAAFAEGIDDDFALVVRWPDGARETITAGDVSVRGLLGYV